MGWKANIDQTLSNSVTRLGNCLKFSWFRNSTCFWDGRCFVNPSAIILFVWIHWRYISPFLTFSRNQCWLISTWRSFVWYDELGLIIRSMVCLLSHDSIRSFSGSNSIDLSNRFVQSRCFAASERATSSASVVDVVTIRCFLADQSIGPPKRVKMKPWELFRPMLSAKLASDAARKTYLGSHDPSNSIEWYLVL